MTGVNGYTNFIPSLLKGWRNIAAVPMTNTHKPGLLTKKTATICAKHSPHPGPGEEKTMREAWGNHETGVSSFPGLGKDCRTHLVWRWVVVLLLLNSRRILLPYSPSLLIKVEWKLLSLLLLFLLSFDIFIMVCTCKFKARTDPLRTELSWRAWRTEVTKRSSYLVFSFFLTNITHCLLRISYSLLKLCLTCFCSHPNFKLISKIVGLVPFEAFLCLAHVLNTDGFSALIVILWFLLSKLVFIIMQQLLLTAL